MTEEELNDAELGPVLLDLFTEAATIEHLMRERYGNSGGLTPQQFGLVNYFVRKHISEESLTSLAWSFQVDLAYARTAAEALVSKGFVTIDSRDCVRITEAGIAKHRERMKDMAADIRPLMAEFERIDLQVTAQTLKDIRRTLDNLPDR